MFCVCFGFLVEVGWNLSVSSFREMGLANEPARDTPGASHSSNPRRSSATKSPDHTASFHFKRQKRSGTLARAGASGLPVRRVGLARQFIVMGLSHSVFAIVADGFNRTSFHGFLAKRLLLRGGRLLKHIGVAAVVAAPEISGCGFPAQVAVNTLVIAVKFSGHVFRVFIRNVGHRFSFVSCRRKFDWSAFRDTRAILDLRTSKAALIQP